MIPAFNQSGVLPPFVGSDSTVRSGVSPYAISLKDLIVRFASTPERQAILKGLIAFRSELAHAGLRDGFQWLDGSFCENVEQTRGRAPGDIDVVTLINRDAGEGTQAFRARLSPFLDQDEMKRRFKVDSYFIDLGTGSNLIVSNTVYWYGLFSHQRDTYRWKGMLQIALEDELDAEASALLI